MSNEENLIPSVLETNNASGVDTIITTTTRNQQSQEPQYHNIDTEFLLKSNDDDHIRSNDDSSALNNVDDNKNNSNTISDSNNDNPTHTNGSSNLQSNNNNNNNNSQVVTEASITGRNDQINSSCIEEYLDDEDDDSKIQNDRIIRVNHTNEQHQPESLLDSDVPLSTTVDKAQNLGLPSIIHKNDNNNLHHIPSSNCWDDENNKDNQQHTVNCSEAPSSSSSTAIDTPNEIKDHLPNRTSDEDNNISGVVSTGCEESGTTIQPPTVRTKQESTSVTTLLESNTTTNVRSITTTNYDAEYIEQLQFHVDKAGEKLLDQLIYHLQKQSSQQTKRSRRQQQQREQQIAAQSTTASNSSKNTNSSLSSTEPMMVGLTIPSSGMGWLASYVLPETDYEVFEQNALSRSMKSRIRLLKVLLPRLTHLRVAWSIDATDTEWPPPINSKDNTDNNTATSINNRGDILRAASRRRKQQQRRSARQQPRNSTTSSTNLDNTSEQTLLEMYLDHYFQWKYNPRIDLRMFHNTLKVLMLDQIPGRCIYNWDAIQSSIQVIRVERTCIYNQPIRRSVRQRNTRNCTDWSLFHVYFLESPTRYNNENYTDIDTSLLIASNPTTGAMSNMEKDAITSASDSSNLYEDYDASGPTRNIIDNKNDPLATPNYQYQPVSYPMFQSSILQFPSLTHVKFSNCCLGEPIRKKLDPESSQQLVSIQIVTPQLQSLCLSRNQIITKRTALSGLANMSFLSSLDLSHNCIKSLKNVHYRIGNIQRLFLSYNSISTTACGIDRLLSLEELALDYNNIQDLASISGLAQLPVLKRLHLNGNPIVKNIWRSRKRRFGSRRSQSNNNQSADDASNTNVSPQIRSSFSLAWWSSKKRNKKQTKKNVLERLKMASFANQAYRVDVLNLFRERRLMELPYNATYRNLQDALPILDDQIVSLEELIALRERTFVPVSSQNQRTGDGISLDHSILVPTVHNNEEEEQHTDDSNTPLLLLQQRSKLLLKNIDNNDFRQQVLARKKRRKRVIIKDPLNVVEGDSRWKSTMKTDNSDSTLPKSVASFKFSVSDVLSSISTEPQNVTVEAKNENQSPPSSPKGALPTNNETADLSENIQEDWILESDNLAVSYLEAAQKMQTQASTTKCIPLGKKKVVSISLTKQSQHSATLLFSNAEMTKSAESVPLPERGDQVIKDDTAADLLDIDKANVSIENDDLRNLSLSAIQPEGGDTLLPFDAATDMPASKGNINGGSSPKRLATTERSVASSLASDTDTVGPPITQISYVNNSNDDGMSVATGNSRLAFRFPNQSWQQDDQSVMSGNSWTNPDGTEPSVSNTMTINATKMFMWAEDNSVYEGPRSYKDLRILDNLELYFRLFVFPKNVSKATTLLSQTESNRAADDLVRNFQTYQQQYPRIQLWPIDRRMREVGTLESQFENKAEFDPSMKRMDLTIGETFRRVWKERVVACGKLSLQRLTPNQVPRYTFHGELVWSTADTSNLRPETVVEHRNVILCLSNQAFYIIQDHDKRTKEPLSVSKKITEQTKKKRFPLPIPSTACFEDAKWPHALVRHPFEALTGITIGFAFQRLTLHFASKVSSTRASKRNSAKTEQAEFTYILLVSNKVQTVRILNEIQQLVSDARERMFGGPSTLLDETATIEIENDDRHVLDALGVAVAPDVIGVILHYQILHQKWRRGDRGLVRRVCVVTDSKMYLLDEDYFRDGSDVTSLPGAGGIRSDKSALPSRQVVVTGESTYRLVDSASLQQISEVQAADADPSSITFVVKPLKTLQKSRYWRLVCRDGQGAERLVEDVRKAIAMSV